MALPPRLLQAALVAATLWALLSSPQATAALIGRSDNSSADDNLSFLPNNTFDYVVVGAGTAGLTVAVRLSEDENRRVAVIDAGLDYDIADPISANIPGADTSGVGASPEDTNDIDWNYTTVAQAGANQREIHYARGKCLGGSSVRNFMIYQRGPTSAYDQWVDLGNPGWGWDDLQSYFKKSLSFTPPTAYRQNTFPTNFDPSAFDSPGGPVQISYPHTSQQFSDFMGRSLVELGLNEAQDFQSGDILGVTYSAAAIDPDTAFRSTSRSGFLSSAAGRSNLVVFQGQMTKQILFNGTRAIGVEMSDGLLNTRLQATREVIVSAGCFGSPQLLQASGIGDSALLSSVGIDTLVDLPMVGQNMQDHIFFTPTFPLTSDIATLTRSANDPVYFAEQVLNFTTPPHLGPLTNNVADMIGFERLSDETLEEIGASSLSSFPSGWPHVEYLTAPGYIGNFSNLVLENAVQPLGSEFAGILGALVAPLSRGSVNITSADTFVPPAIDPNWFTDPVDQALGLYLFKRIRAAFNTTAMAPIRNGPEAFPGPEVESDEDILNAIRDSLLTVWHAACTCAMLPREAGGVLDPTLSVYGVQALRVVDASSFPTLPPGHPTSTVYALAEKAADLIKQANQD